VFLKIGCNWGLGGGGEGGFQNQLFWARGLTPYTFWEGSLGSIFVIDWGGGGGFIGRQECRGGSFVLLEGGSERFREFNLLERPERDLKEEGSINQFEEGLPSGRSGKGFWLFWKGGLKSLRRAHLVDGGLLFLKTETGRGKGQLRGKR